MTLCLLAKWPAPDRTKTRLAADLGQGPALALGRAFLEDACTSLARRGPVLVALEGAPPEAAHAPFLAGCEVIEQGGGDLGARMTRVLTRGTARSARAVVLGADVVGLPEGHLDTALAALDGGADVVLGPAHDGGYYLLGVRRGHEAALDRALLGVRFSTAHALEDTRRRAEREGLKVALAPPFFDVDRAADLERLRAHLAAHPGLHAPATRAALRQIPAVPGS